MALPIYCELCGNDNKNISVVTNHVYGAIRDASFFHCKSCDVRFQYPLLSPEEENQFYLNEFESFMAERSGKSEWKNAEDHIKKNESTKIRRMKYLEPHLTVSEDILEIGCSSGFMLFPLVEKGYRCTGIEPSGLFRNYLKSKGIEVYDTLDVMTQSNKKKFDLIMHFFVLEHISRPFEFLEAQICLLKPGGKIVFEIPNVDDPLYSIYNIKEFEYFYWSVAHPWYFSKSSLQYLLDKLGKKYQIFLDQRYDLSNHLIWARDGRPGGSGRFSESYGKELDELYKQTMIRLEKCDTLVGIIVNN